MMFSKINLVAAAKIPLMVLMHGIAGITFCVIHGSAGIVLCLVDIVFELVVETYQEIEEIYQELKYLVSDTIEIEDIQDIQDIQEAEW